MTIGATILPIKTPFFSIPGEEGLIFPEGGEGIGFGTEETPTQFPRVPSESTAQLFPSFLPNAEQLVWNELNDARQSGVFFPEENELGLVLPLTFGAVADIGLYAGKDESYFLPLEEGTPIPPVTIVRGWPAFPGATPQIGVAISTENEDGAQRLGAGGFAADAFARDELGNILATAAYYAEPLYSSVIVELIHENRDERDRLHDQLRRRLYPLRRLGPERSEVIKEVQVQSEKQDLPVDEQPLVLYVSVFTVEVWSEALIPSEVIVNAPIISGVQVTVSVH